MRNIIILLFLPTALLASMQIECKVFGGAWKEITKQAVPHPYECYAEQGSMAAFSRKLDEVWILDANKSYHCVFNPSGMDYTCAIDGKDTVSVLPSRIVNGYYQLKKFLQ